MDPPRSRSSSIIANDLTADIGEVADPGVSPQDQAPSPAWLAVERDNLFYFETVTFQVRRNLFFCSFCLMKS